MSERGSASAVPAPLTVVAVGSLLALLYALVLIVSRLLADPAIPFDERLLLPLFVLAAIVAAVALRSWWRGASVVKRALCAILILAWMAASYHVSSDDVDWAMENGYDLAGDPWRSSPLLRWARDNAPGRPLYSNWPTAIVLQLGRSAHDAPATADTVELREFVSAVRARQGVVLAFDTPAPDIVGIDVLKLVPGLEQVAQLSDGSVFVATPVAGQTPLVH